MKVVISEPTILKHKMQCCASLMFSIVIFANLLSFISSIPLNSSVTKHNDPKILYSHLIGKKSCFFRGLNYLSGERIMRRNPCHHCVCVKGFVECFWQNCPPPPEGCATLPYEGVCNPSIYNCPIPERNQSSYVKMRRRQKFGSRKSDEGLVRADCVIRGIAYFTGETIGVASNNCLECRCAKNTMYCTPLCCFQRVSVNEDFSINYRTNRQEGRSDPNPLAHLNEELGLPPAGSI